MADFFLVWTASLFTLRTFGAQINWRVISRKVLFAASLFVKQIAYSFCWSKRKRKYVFQWQMVSWKWKWTSIATVPDLCPTIAKILTHLFSRYQLPLTFGFFSCFPTCVGPGSHGRGFSAGRRPRIQIHSFNAVTQQVLRNFFSNFGLIL